MHNGLIKRFIVATLLKKKKKKKSYQIKLHLKKTRELHPTP